MEKMSILAFYTTRNFVFWKDKKWRLHTYSNIPFKADYTPINIPFKADYHFIGWKNNIYIHSLHEVSRDLN